MIFRRRLRQPGLDVPHAVVDDLVRGEAGLTPPPNHWLPEPSAAALPAPH